MADIRVITPYKTPKVVIKEKAKSILGERIYHKVRARLSNLSASFYSFLDSELPLTIELETVNRCNYTCTFCPVNALVDPREYRMMSDELLKKIASDLEEVNYSGLLALFSNNEPLLDPRIVDICRLFRQKARKAYIYILTNGTKLTPDLYMRLFEAGLDELQIDNYNDNLQLIKPVARLLEAINPLSDPKTEEFKSKTKVFLRGRTEVLTNRGGAAPNKAQETYQTFEYLQNTSCAYPFIQLIIRPSGEISMCCNDALGKVTLGNLNDESILEVWKGAKRRAVQRQLQTQGRKALPLCAGCDVSVLAANMTVLCAPRFLSILPIRKEC